MKKNTKNIIKAYYNICNEIASIFIRKYIDNNIVIEYFWVADEPGGVLVIGDYYLNMDTMIDALLLDVSFDDFDKWYWGANLESHPDKRMNLKSWIKLEKKK